MTEWGGTVSDQRHQGTLLLSSPELDLKARLYFPRGKTKSQGNMYTQGRHPGSLLVEDGDKKTILNCLDIWSPCN